MQLLLITASFIFFQVISFHNFKVLIDTIVIDLNIISSFWSFDMSSALLILFLLFIIGSFRCSTNCSMKSYKLSDLSRPEVESLKSRPRIDFSSIFSVVRLITSQITYYQLLRGIYNYQSNNLNSSRLILVMFYMYSGPTHCWWYSE